MSDPSGNVETGGDAEPAKRSSRWQILIGIIGLIVVVWIALQMFGGEHAPGRHAPGGGQTATGAPADPADPAGDAPDDGGHTPPAGGHG